MCEWLIQVCGLRCFGEWSVRNWEKSCEFVEHLCELIISDLYEGCEGILGNKLAHMVVFLVNQYDYGEKWTAIECVKDKDECSEVMNILWDCSCAIRVWFLEIFVCNVCSWFMYMMDEDVMTACM